MIWVDYEALKGCTEKADEPVYNTPDYHYGANNKMDIPCTGCPQFAKCRDEALECQAFRNWASTGNYDIKYRELKLR